MMIAWYPFLLRSDIYINDSIFTRNLKARILDAYQWLAENYVDGDRIFLFGNNSGLRISDKPPNVHMVIAQDFQEVHIKFGLSLECSTVYDSLVFRLININH